MLVPPLDAIVYGKKCLEIAEEIGDKLKEMHTCSELSKANYFLQNYNDAIVFGKRFLEIAKEIGDIEMEFTACAIIVSACQNLNQYENIILYGKRFLQITKIIYKKQSEMWMCCLLSNAYQSLKQYSAAIDYGKTCLELAEKAGDKERETTALFVLATAYNSLEQFDDAIEYSKRCVEIAHQIHRTKDKMGGLLLLANVYHSNKQFSDAIVQGKECLKMAEQTDDKGHQMQALLGLVQTHNSLNQYDDAIKYSKIYVEITEQNNQTNNEMDGLLLLANACLHNNQYDDAIVYGKRCLEIAEETGDKLKEMYTCSELSKANYFLQNYNDAIVFGKRFLEIAKEIGDIEMEFTACAIIVSACQNLNQYENIILYGKRFLQIAKTTSKKKCEMSICYTLAKAYRSLEQYSAVIQYGKKCLELAEKAGDKERETTALFVLATAYNSLEQFDDAIEYSKRCVEIAHQIHRTKDKMGGLLLLAYAYRCNKQFSDAIAQGKKCLKMAEQTNDKGQYQMQALLGLVQTHNSLNQYDDAIEYSKIYVKIAEQNNQTNNEMDGFLLLANACLHNNQYDDAIVYGKRCLEIAKETGDKDKEIVSYEILSVANSNAELSDNALSYGKKWLENVNETRKEITELNVCCVLAEGSIRNGRHDDSIVYNMRFLDIAKEIGNQDLKVEGSLKLFDVYNALEQHDLAFSYFESAMDSSTTTKLLLRCENRFILFFTKFIGAVALTNMTDDEKMLNLSDAERLVALRKMSIIYIKLGQYELSIKCLQLIIEINIGIPQVMKNAFCFFKIGQCHELQSNYQEAIQAYQLAFSYANKSGSIYTSFISLYSQGDLYFKSNDIDNAISVLKEGLVNANIIVDYYSSPLIIHSSLPKLYPSEEDKIFLFHDLSRCHKLLAKALIMKGKVEDALLQLENCRGRLLLEQLLRKYDMTRDVECQRDRLTFTEIHSFVSNYNCSILFYFVGEDSLHRFLIEGDKDLKVHSQTIKNCDKVIHSHINKFLSEMRIQNVRNCENRSLDHLLEASRGERAGPPSEGDDESSMESESQALFHILFRGLSMDELENNLVIIPDGPLFRVPFAALQNPDPEKNGSRLFETKYIRILPSIQTLILLDKEKTTQQDYDDSLIIGNPEVGTVILSGVEEKVEPLPNAEKEAEEIAQVLGVKALKGRYANKPAVLRKLRQSNPMVIHIAAHGFVEKSTIALAPSYDAYKMRKVPIETDYMLTMKEVQRANAHTKLAVLGCCHSGCGETPVEGVIGMCRAFLASGARAVVSTLWAIDDGATLEFMKIFYRNLKDGKSAGTSLRLTMTEMKTSSNQYKDPKYWAPFFLMGEDVTVDIPYEPL